MLPKKYRSLSDADRHRIKLIGIYIFGIILFAVLIKLVVRLAGTDDTVFQTQIKPYPTLLNWLDMRYHTWSGRIFAESFVYIFSPLPLYMWKVLSVAMYALSTAFIYAYYLLFTEKSSQAKHYIMLVIALCLPFLMQTNVLFDGMFWVTGAMNYSWIVTFALIAFYPVAYVARKASVPPLPYSIAGFLSAVVAASSQEQVGAITITLVAIFSGYTLITNRKQKTLSTKRSIYLIAYTLLTGAAFSFGISAPGNKLRVALETKQWLPDFYTIALVQHIEYSYRWFLEAFINHTGFIVAGCAILLSILLCTASRRTKPDVIMSILLGIGGLFILIKGYEVISYWFNFYAAWRPVIPNKYLSYLALTPWIPFIGILLIAPLRIHHGQSRGWVVSLLIGASLGSTALILLSPTIYASGWRTLFVPSVSLMIALYLLISTFLDRFWKYKKIILSVIVALAFMQYFYIGLKLLHHLLSV